MPKVRRIVPPVRRIVDDVVVAVAKCVAGFVHHILRRVGDVTANVVPSLLLLT